MKKSLVLLAAVGLSVLPLTSGCVRLRGNSSDNVTSINEVVTPDYITMSVKDGDGIVRSGQYLLEGGKEGGMKNKLNAELFHIGIYAGQKLSLESETFRDDYFPGLNDDADGTISWAEFNKWKENNRNAIRNNISPTFEHVEAQMKKKNIDRNNANGSYSTNFSYEDLQ